MNVLDRWPVKHDRANRLMHAVAVSSPNGHWSSKTYPQLLGRQFGVPSHLLLSYYYINVAAKTLEKQIEVVKRYKELANGGRIFIDSGVFTYMSKSGLGHVQGFSSSDIRQISKSGLKDLDMYRKIVKDYGNLLRESQDYWEIAIDFDADPFLGSDIADELYQILLDTTQLPPSRFMRVYHTARANVAEWWKNICQDPNILWLGIESILHGWNPDFYNPLIKIAHKGNKKVHVLAATSPTFLKAVPADSVDSSTHAQGAQQSILFTPFGKVGFQENKIEKNHYTLLDVSVYKDLEYYVSCFNYNMKKVTGKQGYRPRVVMNMCFMNRYWDIPYIETPQSIGLF